MFGRTPKQDRERLQLTRTVFSTTEGKQLLRHLMARYHMFAPSIGADTEETAFREGQRTVVLDIMGAVNMTPAQLAQRYEEEIHERDAGIRVGE